MVSPLGISLTNCCRSEVLVRDSYWRFYLCGVAVSPLGISLANFHRSEVLVRVSYWRVYWCRMALGPLGISSSQFVIVPKSWSFIFEIGFKRSGSEFTWCTILTNCQNMISIKPSPRASYWTLHAVCVCVCVGGGG